MEITLDKNIYEIKEWLIKNERSQAWLARHSGVSPENLNRILQGHIEPRWGTIEKIFTVIK
jgi:predicted transcriptional regulator